MKAAPTTSERSVTIYGAERVRFSPIDAFGSMPTDVPEVRVVRVPGGYVCCNGLRSHSAVLTREREWIPEFSSLTGLPNGIDDSGLSDPPPPVSIAGRVGVLVGRPRWDRSYYHWMFQVLPRLHLLRESGIPVDRYLMSRLHYPFQRETLARLGVDLENVIEVDESYCVRADELVVPSTVPVVTPRWVCDFLRDNLMVPAEPGDERLSVWRPADGPRIVLNTGALRPLLDQFGFREFTPDDRSVAEQARAFASASVIVGPHGGALTNLVFCQPGTKVIEFFPPAYVHPTYWMLSSQCGLDHHFLLGQGEQLDSSRWPDPTRGGDSIEVDPDELRTTLVRLLNP